MNLLSIKYKEGQKDFLQPVELVCYSSSFPFGKKCDTGHVSPPPPGKPRLEQNSCQSQSGEKQRHLFRQGRPSVPFFIRLQVQNAAAAATTLVTSAAAIVHELRGASSASRSFPVVFKRHFAAVTVCFWHNKMFSCLFTKTSWRHFRLELFETGETSNLNNPAALQGCRIKWRCLDSADFPACVCGCLQNSKRPPQDQM